MDQVHIAHSAADHIVQTLPAEPAPWPPPAAAADGFGVSSGKPLRPEIEERAVLFDTLPGKSLMSGNSSELAGISGRVPMPSRKGSARQASACAVQVVVGYICESGKQSLSLYIYIERE